MPEDRQMKTKTIIAAAKAAKNRFNVSVSFGIEKAVHNRLALMAKEQGFNISDLVRELIYNFLGEVDNKETLLVEWTLEEGKKPGPLPTKAQGELFPKGKQAPRLTGLELLTPNTEVMYKYKGKAHLCKVAVSNVSFITLPGHGRKGGQKFNSLNQWVTWINKGNPGQVWTRCKALIKGKGWIGLDTLRQDYLTRMAK